MRVRVRLTALLVYLFFCLTPQTFPQTHISSGIVSGNWLKQDSPFYIDGEIKIPRDKKLVIEPGVKVIFTGHHKLIVNGILEAKGIKQDSIYFFPSDTAVGWHGIRFIEAEDFSVLEYCVLKFAKTSTAEDFFEMEKFDCPTGVDCGERFDANGGVILIDKSHPQIMHSLLAENIAGYNGGAINIKNHSNPLIINCRIFKNFAYHDGGGICCSENSNPMIENCDLTDNYSGNMGGGFYVGYYSNAVINNCNISGNIAKSRGGGFCFYTSAKPVVKNSNINSNSSPLGGGIYIDEFYNEFREQYDKIDISMINLRIENNAADYGGGIWLRDTQGELSGVTICNNKALFGGGMNIEHNPMYLRFSSVNPCNIFMNFARVIGNDLFRLGGEKPTDIPLDTFTVKYYSALNAEPVDKWVLGIKNFKLTQVDADLYVSPDGDDSNSGLSSDEPLKTLRIALLRILADSTNHHMIFMDKGEYIFSETNDILMLDKHKYVSVKGAGFTDVIFGTDRITVFTPWWITTWALIIYSSVVIGIIVMMVNVRTRRFKIKSEFEKKEFETKKLHEVDEMKSRFFTNISHEFRTPLTLILGPVKELIERTNDNKTKEDLSLVHRNAKRLLNLVNQLLDISKLESGSMNLRTVPTNLVMLLKALTLSFTSYAERKRIILNCISDSNEIIAYIDKDKMEKIFTNVMSNAFKFTPDGGKIEVTMTRALPSSSSHSHSELVSESKEEVRKLKQVQLDGGGFVEISIRDTGIGISSDKLPKIFDRFYQVDSSHTREHEGTGIGLSLTKELVELHKGDIEVESEEGRGTVVTIKIPLGKDHLKPEEIFENEIEQLKDNNLTHIEEVYTGQEKIKSETELAQIQSLPLLLIVEDNVDVRKYIKHILHKEYNIIEAKDGEDGWNKCIESISGGPDLIISDVMMPKMDGFKLCDKLKTDERTSHIPVILLTAKATKHDKIDGFELGADDYIMKPFETDELTARVRNLIMQRKRLHEHFKKSGLLDFESSQITSIDKKFLQRTLEIIKQHISETSFNVESLSVYLSVSKSVLQKKISALTGETPVEFIRRLRLKKAMELIEKKFGNMSEIALESGFSNPAYFSEVFKKEFGLTPKEYQQKINNN